MNRIVTNTIHVNPYFSGIQKTIMSSESATNWAYLPAKNLHNIFANLELPDINNCFLMCKNWYDEANFFFKDKLWFCSINVEDIENVQQSQRRFQCLKISHSEQKEEFSDILRAVDILEALWLRKLKTTDPILEAIVQYENYPTLSKITQFLGKRLKKLTLINNVFNTPGQAARKSHRSFAGCPGTYANLKYEGLSSVEELSIHEFDHSVLNISRKFGSLRSLKLIIYHDHRNVAEDVMREFIDLNPLEVLDVSKAEFFIGLNGDNLDVQKLLSFENSKNLKELHLREIRSVEDIEHLSTNFRNLKVITTREIADTVFHPNLVDRMFELGIDVNKCFIGYSTYENYSIYKETWANARNLKITKLFLNEISIEEDVLILFTKCFPNVKSFTCMRMEPFSLALLLAMSKNWLNLQSITFSIEQFQQSDTDEICVFPELTKIEFYEFGGDEEMLQFFKHFRAENLVTVSLDFVNYFQSDKEIFKLFSGNCPNIKFLQFDGPPYENQVMETMLCNFLNLEVFTVFCRFNYQWSSHSKINPEIVMIDVLKDVVKYRKTKLEIRFKTTRYLGSFTEFCNENEAITCFEDGQLKKIMIDDKVIIFEEWDD